MPETAPDETTGSPAAMPVPASPEKIGQQTSGVRPVVWKFTALGVVVVALIAGEAARRITQAPHANYYAQRQRQEALRSSAATSLPATSGTLEEQLFRAVTAGDLQKAQSLLQQGANPAATTKIGVPALVSAARKGYLPIVQLLLDKGCNVDIKMADRSPSGELVGGMSALFMAASNGQIEVVKLLIARGADVRLESATRETALSFAVVKGQTDCARLLLLAGADANHKNSEGTTPLLASAALGQTECVKLLLEYKADPNVTDQFGNTPLTFAKNKGYMAIAEALREAGAK